MSAPALRQPAGVRISDVTLRRITLENLDAVLALSVSADQRDYVADNAKSIAQAHYYPEAWIRAICRSGEPVGFLMLHDEHLRPEPRETGYYFLWRLMVGEPYQGQGLGRQAVGLLVEHVRRRPHANRLLTSCHSGPNSPEGFYRRLGFLPTGEYPGGEIELALELPAA